MTLKAFIATLLFFPLFLRAEHYDLGHLYKVDIRAVRPTQSGVGFKEIEFKMEQIEDHDDGDLGGYKQEKAGKAVVGPGGQLFLVDGHHFARALQKYGSRTMWVEVIKDYSDLSSAAFWATMKQKKLVYLKDQTGKTISPSQLPKTIASLKNDPYRSLAWMVRRCGGYTELKTPFQEFMWSELFRKHLSIPANASGTRWAAVVEEALAIAKSDEASHLPGYHGRRASCSKIIAWLEE